MIRLTCAENGANEFWEGATDGPRLVVRFGKVGAAGQEKRKPLASAEAAAADLAKLVSEEKRNGYREDGASPGAPPPTVRAADPPPAAYPSASTDAARRTGLKARTPSSCGSAAI